MSLLHQKSLQSEPLLRKLWQFSHFLFATSTKIVQTLPTRFSHFSTPQLTNHSDIYLFHFPPHFSNAVERLERASTAIALNSRTQSTAMTLNYRTKSTATTLNSRTPSPALESCRSPSTAVESPERAPNAFSINKKQKSTSYSY